MKMRKKDFLQKEVEHIDIKSFNSIPIIERFEKTAFQAKNLARAAKIYDRMLRDVRLYCVWQVLYLVPV